MQSYKLSDLVGNVTVINLLKRSIENQTLPNLCTFLGAMGVGKTTSANAAALALTCEKPHKGEACLHCSSCKENIKALEGDGVSRMIKSINMSKFENRKEIGVLVKEIFDLVPENGRVVYVLNEFHALKELGENAQTIFLEEIDKMAKNVYVFITSTHDHLILNTIVSRSRSFTFSRLTNRESRFLLDKVCDTLGAKFDTEDFKSLVISECKGIPRDLIGSIEFLVNNSVTKDEYKEFTGRITDESLLELLMSMKSNSMIDMINTLSLLLEKRKNNYFVDQLKEFFLKCLFKQEAGLDEYLDVDSKMLDEAIKDVNIFKILNEMATLSNRSSDADIQIVLFKIRSIITNRSVSEIINDSAKVAHVNSVDASSIRRELEYNTINKSSAFKGEGITFDTFNQLRR